ncbi:MAG: dihydropteroate synthase [Actinomycetes bacterium]
MLHPSGLPVSLSSLDRTLVMGVINVTPDSFSDGGRFIDANVAIAHGRKMSEQGADIIDIGGESTRPGSERISEQEELDRVLPVIEALISDGIVVSIDTMRASVAKTAVTAGARMINDISGGKVDPQMLPYVATLDIPFILMHWRGPSNIMNSLTDYDDVVLDVRNEIMDQVASAEAAGVHRSRIAIDPGIGFAKTVDQNWPILKHLDVLEAEGLPILMGASRKKFLGELLARNGEPREMDDREAATTAISVLMAQRKTWCVRVHDARSSRDAVEVVQRMAETK